MEIPRIFGLGQDIREELMQETEDKLELLSLIDIFGRWTI